MKITTTPDVLILDNRPWAIGLVFIFFLFGLGFWCAVALFNGQFFVALIPIACAAFVLVFVWAFVRRDQLILNAQDTTARHRRRTLFEYTEMVHDLGDVDRASVDTTVDRNSGNTHRIVLHVTGGMNAGDHPFTFGYMSGRGAFRGADAVNSWLADHAARP